MPHKTDVVTTIRDEHRTIRRLFDEIDQAQPHERRTPLEALVQLVAVHEAAEQQVVYVAIRDDDQSAAHVIADRMLEEASARQAIADLDGTDPESDDFTISFDAFRAAFQAHMAREEALILPRLAREHAGGLQTLGQAFLAAAASALARQEGRTPQHTVGAADS